MCTTIQRPFLSRDVYPKYEVYVFASLHPQEAIFLLLGQHAAFR
jgi:hypothetical protein